MTDSRRFRKTKPRAPLRFYHFHSNSPAGPLIREHLQEAHGLLSYDAAQITNAHLKKKSLLKANFFEIVVHEVAFFWLRYRRGFPFDVLHSNNARRIACVSGHVDQGSDEYALWPTSPAGSYGLRTSHGALSHATTSPPRFAASGGAAHDVCGLTFVNHVRHEFHLTVKTNLCGIINGTPRTSLAFRSHPMTMCAPRVEVRGRQRFDFDPLDHFFAQLGIRDDDTPFGSVPRESSADGYEAIPSPRVPQIWITKPGSGSCGRGIRIIVCDTKGELKEKIHRFYVEGDEQGAAALPIMDGVARRLARVAETRDRKEQKRKQQEKAKKRKKTSEDEKGRFLVSTTESSNASSTSEGEVEALPSSPPSASNGAGVDGATMESGVTTGEVTAGFSSSDYRAVCDSLVVQEYILNPLLHQGHKFDIRVYVLIVSLEPFVCLFGDGYIRKCAAKYEESSFENKVRADNDHLASYALQCGVPGGAVLRLHQCAHVSNFHVSRDLDLYDAATDSVGGVGVRMLLTDFRRYVTEQHPEWGRGRWDTAEHVAWWTKTSKRCGDDSCTGEELPSGDLLDIAIRRAVQAVVEASAPYFNDPMPLGQFAILGVDLMPTLDGGMYLLEFTKSPAFRVSPSALEELHRPLLQDTIDVMFEFSSPHCSLHRVS